MSLNDSKSAIQQMEQGQKDLGIISSVNSIHKKIINNSFVSELDVFSVPVTLNFKGNEIYQSCFGGFLHILLFLGCIGLTIAIMFPNGIKLESDITVTTIPVDEGDTGANLFDWTDQPIGFKGLKKSGTNFLPVNLTGLATIYAYQIDQDDQATPLQVSSDCQDGYQFCIRKSPTNQIKFYGDSYSQEDDAQYKYFMFQVLWCISSESSTCTTSATNYYIEMSFSNFYQKKSGELIEFKKKASAIIANYSYQYEITRELFTSNNRFFGHLSNLFSFTKETYSFSQIAEKSLIQSTKMVTSANYSDRAFAKVNLKPIGQTRYIKENFDDVSDVLLFFLSVKETLYLLVFYLFVKQYNKNAGLLDIGTAIFYIDNPKTKKKYNFKKGFEVLLACLLHNHFLYNFLDFFLTKCGRTLKEYLPNKVICATSLMDKAEAMLQENVFYGNLNELSQMESQASKKSPLTVNHEEQDKNQQEEKELTYFPFQPRDTQHAWKQKQIRRQAFSQFCQANEFISPQRKNHIYKVLTDNKLKYMLVHEMQTEFKSFVRNARIQKSEDVYQQLEDEDVSDIMVGVHDRTHSQMTGTNFIRT